MREFITPVSDEENIDMIINELHLEELVRCKDCEHYEYYGQEYDTISDCLLNCIECPDENFFCSFGRRKQ